MKHQPLTQYIETKYAYESCPSCYGSGHFYNGEVLKSCYHCHGDGVVRARDDKGRFTKK